MISPADQALLDAAHLFIDAIAKRAANIAIDRMEMRAANKRQDTTSNPITATGWVSTSALSAMLGREEARSALGWCQRHKIQVVRDGKWNFVRLADVRAVLEGLARPGETELEREVREAIDRNLRRR